MKIAVFVNTPAQVHFYKNIVAALEVDDNQVFILARDYGETIGLLNELEIPFSLFARYARLEVWEEHVASARCGKRLSIPQG